MHATRPSSNGFRTLITATLSVRNGPRAIAFYKDTFGALELHRVDGGDGTAVAQLSISGAEFWVADESPEHLNFSPESLGGCSVRMLLIAEDPDGVCRQAVAAGAKLVVPVKEEHGWRLGRVLDPFGHHWEIGRQVGKRDALSGS
jgi:PhnB protein